MSPWLVYLWLKLDIISALFRTIGFFSSIIMIGGIVLYIAKTIKWDTYDEEDKRREKEHKEIIGSFLKKITRIGLPIFIFSILFAITLPTTKEMAVIYIVPKVVNNENIQQIPNDALKLLRKKLNGWLDDNGNKLFYKKENKK